MSSGTYDVTIDQYNFARKTWSGANTPRGQPFRENAYTLRHNFSRRSGAEFWYGGVSQGTNLYSARFHNGDFAQLSADLLNTVRTTNRNALVQKIKNGLHVGNFLVESDKALGSVISSSRAVLGSFALLSRGDVVGAARTLLRGMQGVTDKHGFTSRAARLRNELSAQKSPNRSRKGKPRLDDGYQNSSTDSLNVGDVASTWLAWQYAWKPLISDVFAGMQDLERLRGEQKLEYRKKNAYNITLPKRTYVNAWGAVNEWPEIRKSIVVRRKWVLAEKPSKLWQTGILDPAVYAWELIPFSFVLDWFIPVQDSLEAWSSAPFLQLKSWTRSELRSVTMTMNNWSTVEAAPGYPVIEWRGENYHRAIIEYDRYVGDDVYTDLAAEPEHPFVPLNTLEKAFSTTHFANAAALIAGALSGARKGPYAAQRILPRI